MVPGPQVILHTAVDHDGIDRREIVGHPRVLPHARQPEAGLRNQRRFVIVILEPGRDDGTVVAQANELLAARDNIDLDASGARIEAVLHQFLDHGRRPFDDLARGDLVDEVAWKLLDRHAPTAYQVPA